MNSQIINFSVKCAAGDNRWPPGFRFYPTDEELVLFWLKRKICQRHTFGIIGEIDIYKSEPENFPEQSMLKTGDRQWFFFSPRDRKYPNRSRARRATENGYWKATGNDRRITHNARKVGAIKTLVFYRGRAPCGQRTDWVMHEYTVDEEELSRWQSPQDYCALYKVFKKSGRGPKNGEQYGAPFKEEDWPDDECSDANNLASGSSELPNDVTCVDNFKIDGETQPPLSNFERPCTIANDHALDQCHSNGYAMPQDIPEEGTRRATLVPSPGESVHNLGMHPSSHLCSEQGAFDIRHRLDSLGASGFASAPNISDPKSHNMDGFIEIDDFSRPDSTVQNAEMPVVNLNLEELDGLSSNSDTFHDAQMFFNDVHVDPFLLNNFGNGMLNQFAHQPLHSNNTELSDWLWTFDDQRSYNFTSAESYQGASSQSTGVVCGSTSTEVPTKGYQDQVVSREEGGDADSRSSPLWSFVESIPTTPAFASENAFTDLSLEQLLSLKRARTNTMNTDNAVKNSAATRREGGRSKGFLWLSVAGAACAVFWAWTSRNTALGILGCWFSFSNPCCNWL